MKKNMSTGFVKVFVIMIILSLAAPAAAGEVPSLLLNKEAKAVIADLENLIPGLMKKARVPGLQIALIHDGNIIWYKGFGKKNAAGSAPVNEDTIFEAASLTKPFFAYVVIKLVDEKVLDLDRPLITYLPKKQVEEQLGHSLDEPGFHREWLEKITSRHVLSHSSGLPHGERRKPFPIFFAPGSKYKYSAVGYYFLQLVVEHLKGEKLETIMKKYVLDPLGMGKSSMVWREEYEKTMANGHGYFGRAEDFRKRTRAHAGASLYTTAEEYARFVCAVLNCEGIKKETQKMMLTPQVDVSKEKGLTWSLGFGVQEDGNGAAFWQWGDYGIFRNYIIAYPRHKLGVVYLTNSYFGLGICPDLVSKSIGGQASGNAHLGYKSYDHPVYKFAWQVQEQGPGIVHKLLPRMKAEHPADFSRQAINDLASMMTNEKMHDEAIALYEVNVKENPGSARDLIQLARAYLEKGDRSQAKSYYRKARKVKDKRDFYNKAIDWALAYIKTTEKPLKLEQEYLKKLAGDYQTRHLKLKDGSLYYFREDGSEKEYRKLLAMERDTFIIPGVIYFRLQFEFDSQGQPVKIIGQLEWGDQDQSLRNK